jgi:hydroxypyruvate isomerase
VYGDLEKAAPFAINVQVKVVISNTAGQREATDFQRLAEILRGCNYRGYIALEYEEAGDPRSECRRYIKAMRDAFAT